MNLPFGYYLFNWNVPRRKERHILWAFAFGPSRRYTQITLFICRKWIGLENNFSGQLGPKALSVHFQYWPPRIHIISR